MNLSTVKWAQRDKTQSRELFGLFVCVCIALCTIVAHNIAQNRPDNFPPYPPDNHHCSDDICLRVGGKACDRQRDRWTQGRRVYRLSIVSRVKKRSNLVCHSCDRITTVTPTTVWLKFASRRIFYRFHHNLCAFSLSTRHLQLSSFEGL